MAPNPVSGKDGGPRFRRRSVACLRARGRPSRRAAIRPWPQMLCGALCDTLHMATNLAISPDLLEHALELSGKRTRTAAVTLALQEFIARREQRRLLELFDSLDSRRYRWSCRTATIMLRPPTSAISAGVMGSSSEPSTPCSRDSASITTWSCLPLMETSCTRRVIPRCGSGVHRAGRLDDPVELLAEALLHAAYGPAASASALRLPARMFSSP